MKKNERDSDLNQTLRFDRKEFRRENERLAKDTSENQTEVNIDHSPISETKSIDEEVDGVNINPNKSVKQREDDYSAILKRKFNRLKINTIDAWDNFMDKFSKEEDAFDLTSFDAENTKTLEQIDSSNQVVEEAINEIPGPIVHDESLDQGIRLDDFGNVTEDDTFSSSDLDIINNNEDGYVNGAAWLTAGSMISRILGALYVIPWATWFGQEYTQANNLFSIGYKPYSLLLAIATAGFPSAIAKQIAYYNSKREYKVADQLFKYSFIIMVGTGLVVGSLLYGIAPTLAKETPALVVEDATLVIRSLVPALIILPAMSLIRGYFQGFHDMKPTAVSQVIEQIARVVYMLVATYAIMQVYQGTVTQAVVQSTFAAFIGAIASSLYLIIAYLRHYSKVRVLIDHSLNKIKLDFSASVKLILKDSIPFILIGSGIIIAQLIDLFTFRQILERSSHLLHTEIRDLYGTISLDVDKLMMIIISLAVAMATAAIPAVASAYANHEIEKTSELIEDITIIFLIVMLPAAFGMAAIADNVYPLFYVNGSSQGPSLLITGSISSIVLGAYTLFSTILQSMNNRKLAVKYLLMGLLLKVILQYPFVAFFEGHGALISTMLAFLVTSILMWMEIARQTTINYSYLIINAIQITIPAVLMYIVVALWNRTLNLVFGDVGRMLTFIKIFINILIGMFVYGLGLGIQGKLKLIIGDRYQEFQEKIRLI